MLIFIDTYSRYNQIKMNLIYMTKIDFVTNNCNSYYKVIPFVLKNAGATYQRMPYAVFFKNIGGNL